MIKANRILSILFLLVLFAAGFSFLFAADETLTITTYYPSPYGSYNDLYVANRLGIGTTNPLSKLHIAGGSANWNEATPGLAVGSMHLDPESATDHFGSAITFGASDSSSGDTAQAGIYLRSDGTYGTKMYLATTDAYISGSKTRMMINSNGNIGIGTTSPVTPLTIYSPTTTAVELLSLMTVYNSPSGDKGLSWRDTSNVVGQIDTRYTSPTMSMVFGHLYNSGYQTSDIMTIMGTGMVGIGTTNPGGKLEVRNAPNSGRTIVLGTSSSSSVGDIDGQIVFTKNPGFYDSWKLYSKNINAGNGGADLYLDAYETVSTFKNIMTFLNSGNVGIGAAAPRFPLSVGAGTVSSVTAADFDIVAAGSSKGGIAAVANNKALYLYNNGSSIKLDAYDYGAAAALLVTIGGNGGGVEITRPGTVDYVNNALKITTASAYGTFGSINSGYFHMSTNATTGFYTNQAMYCNGGCNTYSSRDAKTNIAPITIKDEERALDTLLNVKLVNFKYKDVSGDHQMHLGLIAEDAPKPIATPNGKAISPVDYTSYAVAAIKTQQRQIQELQKKIEQLEKAGKS